MSMPDDLPFQKRSGGSPALEMLHEFLSCHSIVLKYAQHRAGGHAGVMFLYTAHERTHMLPLNYDCHTLRVKNRVDEIRDLAR